jgi:hypothetical protein
MDMSLGIDSVNRSDNGQEGFKGTAIKANRITEGAGVPSPNQRGVTKMRCLADADERLAQAMMQERKTSSSVIGACTDGGRDVQVRSRSKVKQIDMSALGFRMSRKLLTSQERIEIVKGRKRGRTTM